MFSGFRDLAMHAAQHLGHHRRDHAQQDGKHPEPGTDLLTVAVEHGESPRRKRFAEERSTAAARHRRLVGRGQFASGSAMIRWPSGPNFSPIVRFPIV